MILAVVGALIRDADGRLLVVRKQGSAIFMLPGGKPEPGEEPEAALGRELDEELGVRIRALTPFGRFEAPAANEPGATVRSTVFEVTVDGAPCAAAEIAEVRWLDLGGELPPLAPLLLHRVLPRLARTAPAR